MWVLAYVEVGAFNSHDICADCYALFVVRQPVEVGSKWNVKTSSWLRSREEWHKCALLAETQEGDLMNTSFHGVSPLLDLKYWDHTVIPVIGQFHVLLYGLVKDFFKMVSSRSNVYWVY